MGAIGDGKYRQAEKNTGERTSFLRRAIWDIWLPFHAEYDTTRLVESSFYPRAKFPPACALFSARNSAHHDLRDRSVLIFTSFCLLDVIVFEAYGHELVSGRAQRKQ